MHWTPKGWVPCLGGGWGSGWTATRYKSDLDFLATTQARENKEAFLQVKRAQWLGDVTGEKPVYGVQRAFPASGMACRSTRSATSSKKPRPRRWRRSATNLGESNETGEKPVTETAGMTDADKKITVGKDGVITIPAAAYSKPSGNTAEVMAMKSFAGGHADLPPAIRPRGPDDPAGRRVER